MAVANLPLPMPTTDDARRAEPLLLRRIDPSTFGALLGGAGTLNRSIDFILWSFLRPPLRVPLRRTWAARSRAAALSKTFQASRRLLRGRPGNAFPTLGPPSGASSSPHNAPLLLPFPFNPCPAATDHHAPSPPHIATPPDRSIERAGTRLDSVGGRGGGGTHTHAPSYRRAAASFGRPPAFERGRAVLRSCGLAAQAGKRLHDDGPPLPKAAAAGYMYERSIGSGVLGPASL